MVDFWFYTFWVLLTLLQVIVFKKYAYRYDKKVLVSRLRYFLWIIGGFIPGVNIFLCVVLPIGFYIIEDIRINTGIGLMKKCRIDKLIDYLNKKV